MSVIHASDFIFSSPEDHVRHPLWLMNGEKAGQVEAYVDYGAGAAWEIEQFWPAPGRGLLPGEMMDQNVLTIVDGQCSRDGAPLDTMKCVAVSVENQWRRSEDGHNYIDTSSDYVNACFAPAEIELGHHEYHSFGTVTYTKHDTPFATSADPARQVKGKFEYLITMDASIDELGALSVTLLEEFWQGMSDTDPLGFERGSRGVAISGNAMPWGYRRLQRYDKGRGLVFLHDIPGGWVAQRFKQ